MKISKDSIVKAFMIFDNVYLDFSKKIESEEKVKEMIDTWISVLDAVDFDYKYANEDFLKATKIATSKNKYVPSVAEIIEEVKKIYIARQREEESKLKEIDLSELTEEEYGLLMKNKITINELIEKGKVHVGR